MALRLLHKGKVTALELESLVDDLEAVGLGKDQATIYVRLLQLGPSKVGSLSDYFDSSRSKLYRLLDELAERGFVTKSLERPTVYEAVNPEELFELGFSHIDRSRNRLSNVQEDCLPHLRSIAQGGHKQTPEHHWKKMEGTAKIYKSLHEMADQASESIWVASNHEVTMSTFLPVVEEAWRIAFRRGRHEGLDVRLLFDFEGDKTGQLPDWVQPGNGVEMRSFQAREPVHFVLADARELLMWVRPAPLGTLGKRDDVAVRTNAPGSVFAHELLFERLWTEGSPVDSLTVQEA